MHNGQGLAWVIPVGLLVLTVFGVKSVRWGLRKVAETRHFAFLEPLAPALSNILYLLGLRVFLEFAPLNPRLEIWIENGIYVLGVFIVLGLLRRSAFLLIEWTTKKISPSPAMQQGFIPLLNNLITLFVFLMGGIMILKHFNYDVMSLLAALGVGSLAIGLAAKETLSNMISGFTLIVDRNMGPGDRINLGGMAGGYTGDVETIGLRSTRITLDDGNTLIVPNSELVNTKLLNLSQPSRATTCNINLHFSLDTPFTKIKAACLAIIAQTNGCVSNGPKSVNLAALADGKQTVSVEFWVEDTSKVGAAISTFHEQLLARLAQDKIHLWGCTTQ